MNPAAEQFVDGLSSLLADDVPAGHFQTAQDAHDRDIRAQGVARAIGAPPEPLDMVWILSFEDACKHVFCHLCDKMRAECGAVYFAHADKAARGAQLDKDEIAPATRWRRIGHNKCFYGLKLHGDISLKEE